ncbi:hypothetical protein D0T50_12670 [Bacteroides sp. 214]|uniref:hypothetical protein n=1 Tax=Bacteroides sp. 214 TaxID=2302935 RepID=UPI0013D3B2D2|nr:hypothetical protein [Bacteroides sp. 214]NDW13736.1 hypothetical protein [Bacteroides sp. 214]
MKNKDTYICRIEELLNRYWVCETSLEEEEELRAFFHTGDVPKHLAVYKELFELQLEEATPALTDEFDARVLSLIQEEKETPRRFNMFVPYLRVAASILLIIGLTFSIHLYNRPDNLLTSVDTYNTPEEALVEIQKILYGVSGQMEKGTDLLSEKMKKTDSVLQIFKQND